MATLLRYLIVGTVSLGLALFFGLARFSRYIRPDPGAVVAMDAQDEAIHHHVDEIDKDALMSALRDESNRKIAALSTRTGLHAPYRPGDPKTVKEEIKAVQESIAKFKAENNRILDAEEDDEDDHAFKP